MKRLVPLIFPGLLAACDETPSTPPGGFPDTSPPDTATADTTLEVDAGPTEPERPAHCSAKLTPGPAPLRRLTKTEYSNTMRDLLGTETRAGDDLPPEEETLGFDNNASGRGVTQIHVERYMLAAEKLIKEAITERRSTIIKCDPNDMPADLCAMNTIRDFGKLAYRRTLTAEEVERFTTWFRSLYPTEGFDGAISMILEVMLQTPHVLYRLELGDAADTDTDKDGVVMLSGFELASRLSYLLWGSMPDDRLLVAAEIGKLATKEGLVDEAERLMEDPRSRDAVLHFHRQWLELTKLPAAYRDAELFPEYNDALKTRFASETERFVDHVIWDGEGDLTTLLSAPYTFVDDLLASFYGLVLEAPEATPGETPFVPRRGFQKVSLDPTRRAGFFTHASILTVHAKYNQTSPVLRGKFVREQILCQHLAPPPANINITPPDLDPNLTTRERFRQHSDSLECAGCHKKMDPLGLTFENYDPLGRWRDTEGGLPIDPSGEIGFTWDADSPVENAVDMAKRLSVSEEVRHCYVTQWFRYTHGRDVAYADECNMFDLMKSFEASHWNIKSLLVAMTQTEAFRYRPVIVPGAGSTVTGGGAE